MLGRSSVNLEMTVELLCEGIPKFLKKLHEKLDGCSNINEHLYLTVIYAVLETGFVPIHSSLTDFVTTDYNCQVLSKVAELLPKNIYDVEVSAKKTAYKCKLKFGSRGLVTLIGLPSMDDVTPYITVNMYVQRPTYLATFSFETSLYVKRHTDGRVKFENPRELSKIVKNEIAVPTKQRLSFYYDFPYFPHILVLPDHIFNKILSYLSSVQKERLKTIRAEEYSC